MKILHIVAGVWPGSGIAEVVAGLCRALKAQGHEGSLATTQDKFISSLLHYCISEERVRIKSFKRSFPKFLYFSWGMLTRLGQEVKTAEVVHVHGCWTFPVWWGTWLALRHKKTLVMSPHGSLDPVRLKHAAWKKRLVGWMDRWLLRRADVVHATCEAEKRWIEAFLGKCANAGIRECVNGGENFLTTRNTENIEHSTLNKKKPRIVVIPNGIEDVH